MKLTSEKIQMIGILINSTIAIVAIATLIYQRIFNTKTLDYNLHPVFSINDFYPSCGDFWTPKLCEASDPNSKHYCTDDHWFNITNTSQGYAFEFSCYLIHKKEINEVLNPEKFKDRIVSREALIKNGKIQYKLPIDSIPFKYYNKSSTDQLFIIIEYKTVNTKSKFRQIFSLSITPKNENNQITDWKKAIKINFPEVVSLKKIYWWQNGIKLLHSELIKAK